jgi:hypothetical protein
MSRFKMYGDEALNINDLIEQNIDDADKLAWAVAEWAYRKALKRAEEIAIMHVTEGVPTIVTNARDCACRDIADAIRAEREKIEKRNA